MVANELEKKNFPGEIADRIPILIVLDFKYKKYYIKKNDWCIFSRTKIFGRLFLNTCLD